MDICVDKLVITSTCYIITKLDNVLREVTSLSIIIIRITISSWKSTHEFIDLYCTNAHMTM